MKKNIKIIIPVIIIAIIAVCVIVILTRDNNDINENQQENKVSNNTSTNSENEVILSNLDIEEKDEIGKEKIEKFLEIYKNSSPKGILVTLGLIEQNKTFNPEDYIDRFYAKTDISYDEFKNKILEYMTEELFNTYYNNQGFKEVDGYLCFSDIGEEEKEYQVTDLTLIENTDTTMTYQIIFQETETNVTETAKIVVVEKDNDYVVDQYEQQ